MNFDVLLEGTMAGAELSALTEAEISLDMSAASEATTKAAYKKAIYKPIKDLLENFDEYIQDTETVVNDNDKIIRDNAEILNELALKKVAKGFNELGLNKPSGENISKAQKNVISEIKDAKKELSKIAKEIDKKLDKAEKSLNADVKQSNKINIGTNAFDGKTKGKQLIKKSKYETNITKYLKNIKTIANDIRKKVNANNKMIKSLEQFGVHLTKLPDLYEYLSGDVKKITDTNIDAEEAKSNKVLDKLQDKFASIFAKISNELNDPSIGTVAVSIGIAVTVYLIIYGVIKSSGGNISNPANIKATLSEGTRIMSEGTIAKKLLILTLVTIFIASVGAAGKAGFNYIKKMIAKK